MQNKKQKDCSLNKACEVSSITGNIAGAIVSETNTLAGKPNSKVINLTVENQNSYSAILVLGTPISDTSEKENSFPTLINSLESSGAKVIDFLPTAEKNKITDNLGTGAKFIAGLNSMLSKKGVFISKIEVVSDDIAQLRKPIQKISVPYNYANETISISKGDFIGGDTQVNIVDLLCTGGIVCDSQNGFAYTIGKAQTVSMNIYIEAIDNSVFKAI